MRCKLRLFAAFALLLSMACVCMGVMTSSTIAGAARVNCHAHPHAGIDLAGCDLRGSNLNGVNLSHANLRRTNLNGSELVRANLTGANLNGAHLSLTDLSGARFASADLSGVVSGSVIGVPVLPAKWVVVNGYLVGPRANLSDDKLSGADLSHADLFDVRLTGADLAGVTSGSIIGNPILPKDWKLENGYLIGPESNLTSARLNGANLSFDDMQNANLTGANLTNSNLPGANMSNAVLTGATLGGTRMNGATLDGVTSGSIVGTPILPSGWLLVNGYLVGISANLKGANFMNANLFGADLVSANLSGAILTGVSSGSVQGEFSVTLPPNWSIKNGYLFGPGANLTGANLPVSEAFPVTCRART